MSRRGFLGMGAALGASVVVPGWSWAGAPSMAGLGGEHAAVAGLGRRGRPGHRRGDRARRGAGGQRGCCAAGRRTARPCPAGLPGDLRDVHRGRPPAARRGPTPASSRRPSTFNKRRGTYLGVAYGVHQRHDEHGHPARGARRLLLQGRRRHEAPHLPHRQVRLRHRLARRLPRPGRRDGRHRRQDAHGARRRPAPAAPVAALEGHRPTRTSRSASATSSSPGTACRPR